MKKRTLSLLLALVMGLTLTVTASAADIQGGSAERVDSYQPRAFSRGEYGQVILASEDMTLTFDKAIRMEREMYFSQWSEETETSSVVSRMVNTIFALPECRMTITSIATGEASSLDATPYQALDRSGEGYNEYVYSGWPAYMPFASGSTVAEMFAQVQDSFGAGHALEAWCGISFYLELGGVAAGSAGMATAYANTQTIQVDDRAVTFYTYTLRDANGNDINYVRLRDIAAALNGTGAQFEVGWNSTEGITVESGRPYTAAGGELTQIFTGDQPYKAGNSPLTANGAPIALEAITLTDKNGGESNYFKLRDLGRALGFNVGYNDATGIFIQTGRPYTDAD